eukprot:5924766-Pleurochrysis_carterae.AAC.1
MYNQRRAGSITLCWPFRSLLRARALYPTAVSSSLHHRPKQARPTSAEHSALNARTGRAAWRSRHTSRATI